MSQWILTEIPDRFKPDSRRRRRVNRGAGRRSSSTLFDFNIYDVLSGPFHCRGSGGARLHSSGHKRSRNERDQRGEGGREGEKKRTRDRTEKRMEKRGTSRGKKMHGTSAPVTRCSFRWWPRNVETVPTTIRALSSHLEKKKKRTLFASNLKRIFRVTNDR